MLQAEKIASKMYGIHFLVGNGLAANKLSWKLTRTRRQTSWCSLKTFINNDADWNNDWWVCESSHGFSFPEILLGKVTPHSSGSLGPSFIKLSFVKTDSAKPFACTVMSSCYSNGSSVINFTRFLDFDATLVWMHMVQAITPGATWCLRKLHIPCIIHNASLPPGGSPVDCGLQRPWANIGPTGPAAQNNIYLPRRGRPHFFRQPERKGVEEEEERRWPIYRDWAPECRTLCSLGGCVLCGTIAVGVRVCVCIGKMFWTVKRLWNWNNFNF